MSQPLPLRPAGEPFVLNTLAVSLPGTATRVLIDQVSPSADPVAFAHELLGFIFKTPPERWVVQVVAQTEYADVLPGSDRLQYQANDKS